MARRDGAPSLVRARPRPPLALPSGATVRARPRAPADARGRSPARARDSRPDGRGTRRGHRASARWILLRAACVGGPTHRAVPHPDAFDATLIRRGHAADPRFRGAFAPPGSGRQGHEPGRQASLRRAVAELAVAVVAPAVDVAAHGDATGVRESHAQCAEAEPTDDGGGYARVIEVSSAKCLRPPAPAQCLSLDREPAGVRAPVRALGDDAPEAMSASHRARLGRGLRRAVAQLTESIASPAVADSRRGNAARVEAPRAEHRES